MFLKITDFTLMDDSFNGKATSLEKDNLCPTNALPSFASIYAVNKVDLLDPRKSFLLKIIPK